MIQFSFRQLTYFVAAAEAGSTSRAAELLHVSQPAISVAIGQLEQAFGRKLFVRRHAQGIDLTPFGRRKMDEVRHLLSHANAVCRAEDAEALTGDLELSVFSTLAPAYLPGLLRAFADDCPGVTVRLRECSLDEIHGDLESGMAELALLYDVDVMGALTRIPLTAFAPYALLPEGHPLGAAATVSLKDLAENPFVLIDMPHSRDYFLSLFRLAGVMPERILRCSSLEMLRGMVAHGFGVSLLVTRPHGDHAHDGSPLLCRALREEVPPQRIILAHAGRSPLTPAALAFCGTAERYFKRRALAETRIA